jgi:hypothetical protein
VRRISCSTRLCRPLSDTVSQTLKLDLLMKKLLTTVFVILSLAFGNQLLAGKYSDGYIIKNGDTILCQIRTTQQIQGLCQSCLQNSILIKDSSGKETEYKSTDIDGFGFLFYKEKYTFVSKVLKDGKPPIFMQVVLLGKKLNLYSFMGEMVIGNHSSSIRNYFLEDDKKRTLVFQNGSANGKRMKGFFSDQPELLALYKQKQPNYWELPDFVNIVNSKM